MSIQFKIDDQDSVSIIQGEDRTLKIRLLDDLMKPVDLTGASVKLEAKSKTNSKVIVRSVALTLVDAAVDVALDRISVPDHGLVENQVVQLSTTGVLPAGLAAATDYYVKVVDQDTIQLAASAGGTAIDITSAAGGGTHTVVQPLITMPGNDAILGTVTVPMDDVVTGSLKAGEKQTPEIEYTISGVTRIVQLSKAWSVVSQAV